MKNTRIATIFVFILILNLIIPLIIIGNYHHSYLTNTEVNNNNIIPKVQSFSKDNYNRLITSEYGYDLGNITVNDMSISDLELGFYLNNAKYPKLADDYSDDALNITFVGMEFIETISPAIYDLVLPDIENRSILTVKLNETLNVTYDTSKPSSEGYLIYGPRLYPCKLLELYVKEESSSNIVEVDKKNYSIDENNFLYFNYKNYFVGESNLNFLMNVIWEFNITLKNWILTQDAKFIYISGQNQNHTVFFNYDVIINASKYGGNDFSSIGLVSANELEANLTLNIPDKNVINNQSLAVDSDSRINIINPDNSIHTDLMILNGSEISLNFTTEFSVDFVNPVGKFWSIDRLVSGTNIRERIYFPNITSGPEYIPLKFMTIYERTINIDQKIGNGYCLFPERLVLVLRSNVSAPGDEPVFVSNSVKEREWINITLQYFIKNEICPFVIKYEATENLKIRIMDNIGMPLIGLQTIINYYGRPYGTYISKDQIQPLSSQTTDINAEIFINNVPNGEYVIYLYLYGIYQGYYYINSYTDLNYLITNIVHFPTWIFIFGLINISLLGLGYKLYQNNKKRK